jgi:hypothetical protein
METDRRRVEVQVGWSRAAVQFEACVALLWSQRYSMGVIQSSECQRARVARRRHKSSTCTFHMIENTAKADIYWRVKRRKIFGLIRVLWPGDISGAGRLKYIFE